MHRDPTTRETPSGPQLSRHALDQGHSILASQCGDVEQLERLRVHDDVIQPREPLLPGERLDVHGILVYTIDARHRTHAHVEDRITQVTACGAPNLPSIDDGRTAAWLQLAALATTLTTWLRHLARHGELAKTSTKTLRLPIPSAPARLLSHARQRIRKDPPGWPWSPDLTTAWNRRQALHPA